MIFYGFYVLIISQEDITHGPLRILQDMNLQNRKDRVKLRLRNHSLMIERGRRG